MDNNRPATKDDLDKLKDTLDRWRVKVQVQVDDHHKALFGNGSGSIGMDEQLRNLTSMMGVLVRLGWLVAGSTVALTISGIIWAAVYIIRSTAP
jgi:hypothetical protein